MERRAESTYSTRFERLLPEMASLVKDYPRKVFRIQVERFGGETFGNIYLSGEEFDETIRMQIDGVEPLALGSFFLAMAQSKGEIQPGGIYIINYSPKEMCLGDFTKKGARTIY